jgi:hypothetical protein
MNRTHVRRVAAFALLAVIALASLGCVTTVGVGYGPSVYGGWGGYGGSYHGGYGGGPIWP